MEKRYSVLQGNMSAGGYGDSSEMKSFDSLEDAKSYMNEIYNDMTGYTKYPHGYLETSIFDNELGIDIDGTVYNY